MANAIECLNCSNRQYLNPKCHDDNSNLLFVSAERERERPILYKYTMTIEDLAEAIRIKGTSNSIILPRAIGPREIVLLMFLSALVLACSENESLYICFISLPPVLFLGHSHSHHIQKEIKKRKEKVVTYLLPIPSLVYIHVSLILMHPKVQQSFSRSSSKSSTKFLKDFIQKFNKVFKEYIQKFKKVFSRSSS